MTDQRAAGELGVSALVSIGIGGTVGGGIFSVLGLTYPQSRRHRNRRPPQP